MASEKYYNQPKHGIGPNQWEFLSSAPNESSEKDERGFYNVARGEVDIQNIENLSDYQNFVNKDWKRQHGTFESTKRFCDGLSEEYREFVWEYIKKFAPDDFEGFSEMPLVELYGLIVGNPEIFSRELNEDEEKEIISEAGDVVFYTIATMSNSSADLDVGMKSLQDRHLDGVRIFGNEQTASLIYRNDQSEIAHSITPVSVKQIDKLIDSGFETLPFFANQTMNISPDEGQEFDLTEHFLMLLEKTEKLQGLAYNQYQYSRFGEPIEPEYIKPYDDFISSISEVSADILLEVSYIVKHTTGRSLQNIIDKNIDKITGRVTANRIDKADGERTPDLL